LIDLIQQEIYTREVTLEDATYNFNTYFLTEEFTISRGSVLEIEVVRIELKSYCNGTLYCGVGEARLYDRYGDSRKTFIAALDDFFRCIHGVISLSSIERLLPPGAVRNALDNACWDLHSNMMYSPLYAMLGLDDNFKDELSTCFTISLDTSNNMAMQARIRADNNQHLLKVKLGNCPHIDEDLERLRCIVEASPNCKIVVDVNEGWSVEELISMCKYANSLHVMAIEQPLPVGNDMELKDIQSPVPIIADESICTSKDLQYMADRYDGVNIKLDKAGGLTESVRILQHARDKNMLVMIGCMVSGSVSIAPAFCLGQRADIVDLDGAELIGNDHNPCIIYRGGSVIYSK